MVRIGLALVLALGGSSLAAKPVVVAPEAQAFTVGSLKLFALRDALNVVPNDGSVFGKGVDPAQVAAVLRSAGAPTDQITLGVDALLVEGPGRVVLIDTGLGPSVGGVVAASLVKAGTTAAAVTDVLTTHSHGDHVGGLLTADGKLAFPNAAIHMSLDEWIYLQAQPKMAAMVAAIGPKVQTFANGSLVVPGIMATLSPGHTPGHSTYEIADGGQVFLDIGDTAHSSIVSLARPDWVIGYDGDANLGQSSRLALLARLAASHELVFAPHFPFPGVGRIAASGKGYVWQPSLR